MYVPTKLLGRVSVTIMEQCHVRECIPSEVQIWSSVQVQFILQHLVDCFRWCSLLGDSEFENLLLAGITSRIWSDGGGCALGLDMMLVGFGWVVMDILDEGVRVDL